MMRANQILLSLFTFFVYLYSSFSGNGLARRDGMELMMVRVLVDVGNLDFIIILDHQGLLLLFRNAYFLIKSPLAISQSRYSRPLHF